MKAINWILARSNAKEDNYKIAGNHLKLYGQKITNYTIIKVGKHYDLIFKLILIAGV